MRSEIGKTPYAAYYMPHLDGVELKHCRMPRQVKSEPTRQRVVGGGNRRGMFPRTQIVDLRNNGFHSIGEQARNGSSCCSGMCWSPLDCF